ncbi:hypothetical protein E4U53_007666 [Claviceps sorghi]|nr:hypothetical protein E4U53_007666 [Claviceps sorghi]
MKSAYAIVLFVFSGASWAAPTAYIEGGMSTASVGGSTGVGKYPSSNDKCQRKLVPTYHDGRSVPDIGPERIIKDLNRRDNVLNHAAYALQTDGNTKNIVNIPRPTDPIDSVKPGKSKNSAGTKDVPGQILDSHKRSTPSLPKNAAPADGLGSGLNVGLSSDILDTVVGLAAAFVTNGLGGGVNGEVGIPAEGTAEVPGAL